VEEGTTIFLYVFRLGKKELNPVEEGLDGSELKDMKLSLCHKLRERANISHV